MKKTKAQVYRRQQIALIVCASVLVIAIIALIIVLLFSEAEKISSDMSTASSDISVTETTAETQPQTEERTEPADENDDTEPTENDEQYSVENVDGMTYVDGILIANKTYSLPEDYDPGENEEALQAFYEMQSDAAYEGLDIYISSGYRSYGEQAIIYQRYCDEDGQELADTYSSRPGHSDHQTGLAFDLNSIDDSFGYTAESDWVAENCYKYGFIIRFPEGKDEYTGYQYEPWHIRYIGREKAEMIYKSGLSLEEFYGLTSEYED